MLHPQATHLQSEFVQEWVKPQHICAVAFANIVHEDGTTGILGALRYTRSFYSEGEGELDVLRALLPHLHNAMRWMRLRTAFCSLTATRA